MADTEIDAIRFAAAAGAADVPVTLEVWPKMIHAKPLWNVALQPGRRALVHMGRFLHEHSASCFRSRNTEAKR